MCGISGFIDILKQTKKEELESIVSLMSGSLQHRGPDDAGIWIDEKAGIALGHRRLSVLDISPEGHQPMVSENGRYVISFNGEIYNFKHLRTELSALNHSFLSRSDTEVILAAVTQWGLKEAVERFVGMFAFALWDRKEQVLFLVRDRLGIKPLYYGWLGNVFVFASELKAIKAHPDFHRDIDRNALAGMMCYRYVPAPGSIYKGIYKLLSGTWLEINAYDICKNRNYNKSSSITPQIYWSAKKAAEYGIANPFRGGEKQAIEELDLLLRNSIKLCMISDVPLGVFLSGGIDSSTVAALMQAQSSCAINTFSIGFYEDQYNEAVYASGVAKHLGTKHTELYVTPAEAMGVIPELPVLYDEPFADPSQIPTFLVSGLARRHVTVCLSGDGGDELFGGYTRYIWLEKLQRITKNCPSLVRRLAQIIIEGISVDQWDRILSRLCPNDSVRLRYRKAGERLHNLSRLINASSAEEMYKLFISCWYDPREVVIGTDVPVDILNDRTTLSNGKNVLQQWILSDTQHSLQEDMLTKVDRASMGVSLEARVPILDHRVVEFAFSLPVNMKIRQGKGKWLLRKVLCNYVPGELIERQKMGFGVPIDKWIRGPLRDWAESLLEEKRLHREGFLKPEPIRRKWEEHMSGRKNWKGHLWNVLMFQAWLNEQ